MTKPRLYAVHFEGEGPNSAYYDRMARVLDFTSRRHCPDWDIEIERIGSAASVYSNQHMHSHISNTHKLDYWNRHIQAASEGDRVLLIDGDMMIINPIDEVWTLDFDIVYTTKRHKLPFNGGVVFVRVSEKLKRFMADWWALNLRLLNSPGEHSKFRKQFGGMNQASFGALLPKIQTEYGLKLQAIPCAEWNCEQSAWERFNPRTVRIVHIKSGLRKAIFGRGPIEPYLTPMIDMWKGLEKEALLVGAVAR